MLRHFRVSLLEMFCLISGVGIGLSLLLVAGPSVQVVVSWVSKISVLVAFSIAMADVKRRGILLSFAGTVLFAETAYGYLVPFGLLDLLHDIIAPAEKLRSEFYSVATDVANLFVAVICAWMTRSLTNYYRERDSIPAQAASLGG